VAFVGSTASVVVEATCVSANFSGASLRVSSGEANVAESGNAGREGEVVLGESAGRGPGVSVCSHHLVGGGEADVAESGNAGREGEVVLVLGTYMARSGPRNGVTFSSACGDPHEFVTRATGDVRGAVVDQVVCVVLGAGRLVGGGETNVAESGNTSREAEVVFSSELVLQHAVALGIAGQTVVVEEEERNERSSDGSDFTSSFYR